MPRQIIDTESSRPAYVRRNATIAAFVIIIVAVLAYAVFVLSSTRRPAGNPYGSVTTKSVQPPNQPAGAPGK